jgi:TetR/AcrR family transcriptional regulator, transcriptional repressor for nem operon
MRIGLTASIITCILVGMLTATKNHSKRVKAVRTRDPERTRQHLLQAAFHEIYKSGYQSADLDAILGKAGVTKGALYHHFENKEALGYAVIDEVITAMTREKWLRPLESARNPIDALIGIFATAPLTMEDIRGGCPLNNLAQEMSSLHEGFRKRIAKALGIWHSAIANGLREGQKAKQVRPDIDPDETATFIMALYEGYVSLSKNSHDPKLMESGHNSLIKYLESLRDMRTRK